MDSYWAAVVWSLLPTVIVLGLFVYILRSILRVDRRERHVYAEIEAEEREKRGLPPRVTATPAAAASATAASATDVADDTTDA